MHCRIPESVIHIECLDLVSGEYLDLLHYSLAGPIRKNPWDIFLDPPKTHTTIIIFKNRIHRHQQLAIIADRTRVVWEKSMSVRGDSGGCRNIKTQNKPNHKQHTTKNQ